ncbi:MAG: SpoIIE family protein phosphatase [Spirochaetales bacterium]|nr:SpoIIE family protein phosphatase [Spirochaetales bacterium]
MSLRRALTLVVLILGSSFLVHGQTLGTGIFWDNPKVFVPTPARHFQATSTGNEVILAWQESSRTGEDEGEIYLHLKSSTDGAGWRQFPRAVGPFAYVGEEVRIYSLAASGDGTAYLAVSSDKQLIDVYKLPPGEEAMEKVASIAMDATTVAPTLYTGSGGGLLLFATQEVNTTDVSGRPVQTTGIVYARSADGSAWSAPQLFVQDPAVRTTLHFLPRHAAVGDRDYVVFQAWVSDPQLNRQSNQLYLKMSDDGGESWTSAVRLTDFSEFVSGSERIPGAFNNENPFLYPLEDRIILTWERRIDSPRPQVYYGELDTQGSFLAKPEPVTRSVRSHRAPRAFAYQDRIYLLWFDNRGGADHVVLAYRTGIVWNDFDLSESVQGISQFAVPYVLNGDLYILWENRREQESSIVLLGPDRFAPSPTVSASNFTPGRRHAQDSYAVTWNLPEDSSRLEGFSVLWSQNPDDAPEREVAYGINERYAQTVLDQDGTWYVHVAAKDRAGNWSQPARLSVFRDTTPPGVVVFDEPELDNAGFLVSNTYTFGWKNPPDVDIAGYSYRFQLLFTDTQVSSFTPVSLEAPAAGINITEPRAAISNRDNGLWALSVAAIDTVGNTGEPETLFFRLDKYVPVTYITSIRAIEDDIGRLEVSILGRGFAAGGYIRQIILDSDKQGPPWDYAYRFDTGAYQVVDDRTIRGLVLQGLSEGDYWVGVDHPLRGVHFAPAELAVKPMGKIKFGDFAFRTPLRIYLTPGSRYSVSFNIITAIAMMTFLAFLLVFSLHRVAILAREGRMLQVEVRKLLTEQLPERQRLQRIAQMKKKGFGLRLKFSMVTIMLVIATVLLVSFPLTILMTGNQEQLLAEGLEDKAGLMLESAASGARTYLPDAADQALQLVLLPRLTEGVDETQYLTVTGEGIDGAPGYDYVWATNDPAVGRKINTPELNLGVSRLQDDVSPLVEALAAGIETEASQRVTALREEVDELQARALEIALASETGILTAEQQREVDVLSDQIKERRDAITNELLDVGNLVLTYPEYSAQKLSRENTDYVFYKPVVYMQQNDNRYFHGMVRLGVSTVKILNQIEAATRSLIIATGIIALIAVGIGIASALVLSSIIIRPIRKLVQGVEVIRDTEDKEELRSHVIDIRTRDEIAALADTVNQMTVGLVAAAAANKDLILGKDTQKMFTPLKLAPDGKRKLTTAEELTEKIEFFGYYEGAKGVSGDYFDFAKLDDQHYAIIKCDVAGKGVPASLIMVEVATIFLDYFRNWSMKSEGIHLERLVYRINDLVEQRGFQGRFAALLVVIMNIQTGATYFCNAGDKFVHIYDAAAGKTVTKSLPEAPATGVFPSDMVEMGAGFKQIPHVMKSGDCLLLFTDGVEEDKRYFRNEQFQIITCQEENLGEDGRHGTHGVGEDNEEFGIPRIYALVDAVMKGGTYKLEKYHNPIAGEELNFDFSGCQKTVKEAVLAMAALDKVFRLNPDPSAGPGDRIRVDINIDQFLKEHFLEYSRYFQSPTPDEQFPEYVYYTNLKEDDQYDDLTILGIRKV